MENIDKFKEQLDDYYKFTSSSFNLSYDKLIIMNYNSLIKIIENEYKKLSVDEKRCEYIRLRDYIRSYDKENNSEKSYYILCLDILNQSYNYEDSAINEVAMTLADKDVNKDLLIDFWDKLFGTLEKISIFSFVRRLIKTKLPYKFVDGWIMGNLIAAILSSVIIYNLRSGNKILIYPIFTYAALRVFEVVIYQINVLLFHPRRSHKNKKIYKVKSVTRMVIALLSNYVEIMFWYTTMIICLVVLNEGDAFRLGWLDYVTSNILSIATLDSSLIKDTINNTYGNFANIIFVEIISGIIMTVISLASFVGALPSVNETEN